MTSFNHFLKECIECNLCPSYCLTCLQTSHLHKNTQYFDKQSCTGLKKDATSLQDARRQMFTLSRGKLGFQAQKKKKKAVWVICNSRQHTPHSVVNNILRFQFSNACSVLILFYRIIPDMVNVKPCLLHDIYVYFLLNRNRFLDVLHFI